MFDRPRALFVVLNNQPPTMMTHTPFYWQHRHLSPGIAAHYNSSLYCGVYKHVPLPVVSCSEKARTVKAAKLVHMEVHALLLWHK